MEGQRETEKDGHSQALADGSMRAHALPTTYSIELLRIEGGREGENIILKDMLEPPWRL